MSIRIERVNSEILKELSIALQRMGAESLSGVMLSVSRVQTAPDLKTCNAHISVYPATQKKRAFEFLEENASQIKHELAHKLRHMHHMPTIRYLADDGFEYSARIDKVLSEIKEDQKS